MSKKRYNPPSEDFAETKQKLRDTLVKLEQVELTNKRLRLQIKQLDELIADILDDFEGEIHVI